MAPHFARLLDGAGGTDRTRVQVLIITNTYTANLAAFLTVDTLKSSIKDVADLQGKRVATVPSYVKRLERQNIRTVGYGGAGPHDMHEAPCRGQSCVVFV
jgi:ABC-type amino acid transport substrate-binding protein